MCTRFYKSITRILTAAVLLFCLGFSPVLKSARASALTYGLLGENALLYSKSGADYVSKVNLPPSYFVVILGEQNTDGYIPVSYSDITGFVKPDAVTLVDYEPKYKYADDNSLRLKNDGHGVTVRSSPDHTQNNAITSLPEGETLYYYGSVSGSFQVEPVGNEWFFVRFTLDGEQTRGYVYSLYADAEPIKQNVIEKVEPPAPPVSEDPDKDTTTPSEPVDTEPEPDVDPKFTLTQTSEIIIVVSLCIPVVIIMYLLFKKPPKKDE